MRFFFLWKSTQQVFYEIIIILFYSDDTDVFAEHDEEEHRSHRGDLIDFISLWIVKTIGVHGQQMGC